MLPDKDKITDAGAKKVSEFLEKLFDKTNGYLDSSVFARDIKVGHTFLLSRRTRSRPPRSRRRLPHAPPSWRMPRP